MPYRRSRLQVKVPAQERSTFSTRPPESSGGLIENAHARVAKSVDASGLGPDDCSAVLGVRVPPRAPSSIGHSLLQFCAPAYTSISGIL